MFVLLRMSSSSEVSHAFIGQRLSRCTCLAPEEFKKSKSGPWPKKVVHHCSKCSSLYCGLPQVRLQPLNGILWVAARMIGGVPRFGHITDYMRDVPHWLPVQQRIHYRISSILWHCVLGNAPSYLLELFT